MKPRLAILLVAALAYQATALPLYEIGPAAPDFVLIAVLYAAAFERPRRGLAVALSAGALVDALSADPLGARALGYLLPAWVFGLAGRAGWAEDPIARMVLAACASLAAGAGRAAVLAIAEPDAARGAGAFLGDALYAAILAPVVFSLIDPLRSAMVPETRRLVV